MKNNIQKILNLIRSNKFEESLDVANSILNQEKNFDLINLKGLIYFNLKEYEKSYNCYSSALKLNSNSFGSFFSRATALFELGKFEEAIEDFKKSLLINNKAYQVFESIGKCYSNLGENKKTIKYYNLALKLSPNNFKLIEMISEKLSETTLDEDKKNNINETNFAIQSLKYNYSLKNKINDDEIKNLFVKAEKLIDKKFNNLIFTQTQIFRKNNLNLNCDRHFLVFNRFDVIPEFCFSCIKVTINLYNVVDLIKLFLIFNNISLPNNNLRKCMIDLRPNSKVNYKGFIYCRSIQEAEDVKSQIDKIIKINISNKISANVKRGCSEFNKKYPGYENVNQNKVYYNSDWKKHEITIDEKYPKYKLIKKNYDTIKGISFNDIMIIKNWLFFAKLIKDETYKKITQKIIVNPNLEKIIKINKLNNKKINLST